MGSPLFALITSAILNSLPLIISFIILFGAYIFLIKGITKFTDKHILGFVNYVKTKMPKRFAEEASEIKLPPIYSEFLEIAYALSAIISGYSQRYTFISSSLNSILGDVRMLDDATQKIISKSPDQISLVRNMSLLADEHSKTISSVFDNIFQEEPFSNKHSLKGMDELIASSKEISSNVKNLSFINTIIGAIQDQFNMLYVNASIEATKAGEYGLGFSVVADEMKLLAEKNFDQANEIKDIINRTREDIESLLKSLENVSEQNICGNFYYKERGWQSRSNV